jgi:hypothetical protein
MPVVFERYVTRSMLRARPADLFVFGDNLEEYGMGGQAAEMRGEPNAVGLPTKRRPTREPQAYCTDADLPRIQRAAAPKLAHLRTHLTAGGTVVWPQAGIGTGRADLATCAPAIAAWYTGVLAELRTLVSDPRPDTQEYRPDLMNHGVPNLRTFVPCSGCRDAVWQLREGYTAISGLLVDYDGARTAESLRQLLDEVDRIASKALNGEPLYTRG